MRLSELAAQVDGDPELMIDGPDSIPVPVSGADIAYTHVPGAGVVLCLVLETHEEED
ncbi:hypothetical protein GCM10010172_80250 [Paractinoplanes ferrugineus]|uniref:Uncharacterized protein n=1 Tax=Paractinoplanes ferrugineus TaxID=113564 RepID=A0A919MEC8_9ACTN|nr:hypothetical protein [Actinoplanes ferrugineus]GIE16741.1 hypothetical protein Afe05nite_85810 [Actinoplanes ferrugineus]